MNIWTLWGTESLKNLISGCFRYLRRKSAETVTTAAFYIKPLLSSKLRSFVTLEMERNDLELKKTLHYDQISDKFGDIHA